MINDEKNHYFNIEQYDGGDNGEINNNYLHEHIEENVEEYSNKENEDVQENVNNYKNEVVIKKKEIIINNDDVNKTSLKNNSDEKNKKYIDGMINVLEEESGKKERLSTDKKS